jgi:hypothetical protein
MYLCQASLSRAHVIQSMLEVYGFDPYHLLSNPINIFYFVWVSHQLPIREY